MGVVLAIGAAIGFWTLIYVLRWLTAVVILGWAEPRLYEWLHLRALDRALGKPYGTMQMRRRLDQRDGPLDD